MNATDDPNGIEKLEKVPSNNIGRNIMIAIISVTVVILSIYLLKTNGGAWTRKTTKMVPISVTDWTLINKAANKHFTIEVVDGNGHELKYQVKINDLKNHTYHLPQSEKVQLTEYPITKIFISLEDGQGIKNAFAIYKEWNE